MTDRIYIEDLTIRCLIGINDDERINKQDVVINLSIEVDLTKPCASDDVSDTLDYKVLKKKIYTHIEDSSYFLIEKMAQSIADIVLEDKRAEEVTVRVDKPGALRFAESVAVEITRTNG